MTATKERPPQADDEPPTRTAVARVLVPIYKFLNINKNIFPHSGKKKGGKKNTSAAGGYQNKYHSIRMNDHATHRPNPPQNPKNEQVGAKNPNATAASVFLRVFCAIIQRAAAR